MTRSADTEPRTLGRFRCEHSVIGDTIMKRLLICAVAVMGLFVLADTASASHRHSRGPRSGFGISVGPGYIGGGYYSGYRRGYYARPYYGRNGYYGSGYYSSPYYYSYPSSYYVYPQGSYYYSNPSFGICIGP